MFLKKNLFKLGISVRREKDDQGGKIQHLMFNEPDKTIDVPTYV